MKVRLLAVITLSLLTIMTASQSWSQTCRVKTTLPGCTVPVFTEVYEYDYVDEKPEFPGGSNSLVNYINDTRNYPVQAYKEGIEGRVTCSFVVNADGKVSHIQVLRGVENSLNEEAIRIVTQMPAWKPGKINGQQVPVRVVCCIPFRK